MREINELTVAEIDVKRLNFLRRRNKTFFDGKCNNKKLIKYDVKCPSKSIKYRNINPYPFIPSGELKVFD